MRDRGLLEPLARGVYRLTSAEPLSIPDLAIVALKAPRGIVCLISALAFHGITTQVPHAVDLALPSGARAPRLEYPPVHFIWVSHRAFEIGVEEYVIDHILIRVYSPERAIADCFKYRNQLGRDVAREALQLYVQRKSIRTDALLASAQACRVTKIMTPYLEALL
jgi:predicted transcriptional regulator of viral defense system